MEDGFLKFRFYFSWAHVPLAGFFFFPPTLWEGPNLASQSWGDLGGLGAESFFLLDL